MRAKWKRQLRGLCLPLVLFVAGCAASPPPPPPVPLKPLAPTASRLLFFRPYNLVAMGGIAAVEINGASTCNLANGKGFGTDVAPGAVAVTATLPDSMSVYVTGTSSLTFTASAGQTYYIVFRPAPENFGAIGVLVEAASAGETGPFDISLGGPDDLGKFKPMACSIASGQTPAG